MAEEHQNGGAGKHRYWGEILKDDVLAELKPIRAQVEGLSLALTEHRTKDHKTPWVLIVGSVAALGVYALWVLGVATESRKDVQAIYTFLLTRQPQPRLQSTNEAAAAASEAP